MKNLRLKDYLLSIQHLFAMFGATVLVPLLTGMNPSVALFTAGLGTILFHICTKFKVPVFLGSSFAFLPALIAIIKSGDPFSETVPLAQGGIIFAGLFYLVFAVIVYFIGADRVKKLFPPIVTGPVIVVIGINLAAVAIKDATGTGGYAWADFASGLTLNGDILLNIGISVFTLAVVVICSVIAKGYFKLVPILIGIAAGYLLCVILHFAGVYTMDFSAISNASFINIPFVTTDANGVTFFSLPKFDLGVILSIAPIAIVTFMEHIGDITTNGNVVGKDFIKDPGLHRTLMGDGFATALAGFLGGPPNTTYSENTGVLAATKNYNPLLLRITACIAIFLGLFGKFGAVLQTIPGPVKGGIEIILFGMIASIGIRTLSDAQLDFTHSRNLIIVGLILVLGLGLGGINGLVLNFGTVSLTLTGLFVAVVFGVLVNAILPNREEES